MLVDKNLKPFIIAEIGNNHEGNLNLAKRYIRVAKVCGVDAVKFQAIRPEHLVLKKNKKRYSQLKKFELSLKEYKKLSQLAKKLKLKFGVSVFDIESVKLLKPYVDFFKIASSDNNYFELIKSVLKTKKKTIISLGLLNFKKIKNLVKYISRISNLRNTTLLHCVTDYPAKPQEANLRSILYLKKRLKMAIGYSDHTLGLTAPILATSYGADILEKHFTLDNNQSKFRDHKISLNPKDMKKMVDEIKKVKQMLGNFKKDVSNGERKNLTLARRSIYLKKDLPKNHIIQKKDLILLRPVNGLPIEKLETILGKKLKKKIKRNIPLKINNFK
tara:strand:+ start:1238 stop:2227 length:990 start_codon:yes stop_codon:yes gene_type:complete